MLLQIVVVVVVETRDDYLIWPKKSNFILCDLYIKLIFVSLFV